MYRISAPDEKSRYHVSELAKMFLPEDGFRVYVAQPDADLLLDARWDYDAQKRRVYEWLSRELGKKPDWGILTGVRPSKLYNEILASGRDPARVLREEYFVSEEKTGLLERVSRTQRREAPAPSENSVAVYIGIPFCPTRCQYCSFTSNRISKAAASEYLKALFEETDAVLGIIKERGAFAESVYIGGGTPTSLDDADFEALMERASAFAQLGAKEFTVEAGRPETISPGKLELIKAYGAGRISINPQSMKQKTLNLIGRAHTPQQITEAFGEARKRGMGVINADLIAGLPQEEPEDFENSLNLIAELSPENITVHTLAVKRASRLIEEDSSIAFRQAGNVRTMLAFADEKLSGRDYSPYYMYRQKHMAGNFENVGWCRPGTASLYNMRIMEENQTVIAMGAGAISKLYFPEENRLERIANVSDYRIYCERIGEMIDRKRKGILMKEGGL